MFGRDFFGGQTFGGARPTARLAGRPRLGQTLTRCKPPDGGATLIFDTNYEGSGQCGAISSDVSDTSSPACVPDTRGLPFSGAWMPSSCAIAPVEPGGLTPAPAGTPESQNLSVGIIACPIGDNLYNLYEDTGAPPYRLVSEGRNNAQANEEGHILPSTDPRCVAALAGSGSTPPAPLPPSYAPPPAAPPPPSQVSIQPTPFGAGGVTPRQVPFAPAPRGMPPQRSTFTTCPASRPPVQVRQLRRETSQARPDNFPDPLWTKF